MIFYKLSGNTVQHRLFFRSDLCTDVSQPGPRPEQSANQGLLSAMTHPILVLPCKITLLCLDCAPIIRNENSFEKGDSFVKKIPSPAKREGILILLYENDLF